MKDETGVNMIGVTQAVDKAVEFSKTLEGHLLPVEDPLLEEIESDDARNLWLVTLSFAIPEPKSVTEVLASGSLDRILGDMKRAERLRNAARAYRQFKIDKDKGEVVSMKSVKL